jgi:hypothetical protein
MLHLSARKRKPIHEEGSKSPDNVLYQLWTTPRQLSDHTLLLRLLDKLLMMSLGQPVIDVRIEHFWIVSSPS